MNNIITKSLSNVQWQEVHALVDKCKLYEPTSVSLPEDFDIDDDYYYLLTYDNDCLISVASLCRMDDTTIDIAAFTLPTFRRNGCFKNFLKSTMAIYDLQSYTFLVLTDGGSRDANAVLNHLAFKKGPTEYFMQWTIKKHTIDNSIQFKASSKIRQLSQYHSNIFHLPIEESISYVTGLLQLGAKAYELRKNGTIVGISFIILEGEFAYLSGFGILPPYQNQGYAKGALKNLPKIIPKTIKAITLQVSDTNSKALALYKTFGYTSIEQMSEYKLTINERIINK